MLIIDTDDFQLYMEPASMRFEEPGGPYLEWLDVHIKVQTPGICAEGVWSIMPEELRHFLQRIQAASTAPQSGQEAGLISVQPGFSLILRVLDRGVIAGEWVFQPMPPDGAIINGRCGLDQSYLDGIAQGVEALLSSVRGGGPGSA